jgi:hypothetical protein
MNDSTAVKLQADHTVTRRLGNWTTETSFEVRARRGAVVIDLRSPEIPDGDIEIRVDLDHSMLKLLVPDDATVDSWDLRQLGRGRVKDMQRSEARPDGRVIRLVGETRSGEVRINRAGIAVISAMFTREWLDDVRRAHKEGRMPVVADPRTHV